MSNIVSWVGNHNTQLPKPGISAWMSHGRGIGENNYWMASLSVCAPDFGFIHSTTIYGVQDDFGNFVEVKK